MRSSNKQATFVFKNYLLLKLIYKLAAYTVHADVVIFTNYDFYLCSVSNPHLIFPIVVINRADLNANPEIKA